MQDRTRNRGPRIAELEQVERGAGRDLAWIVACGVVLLALALATDPLGALTSATDLEGRDLNGAMALLVLTPIGSALYAGRRYREGMAAQRTLARLTVHDQLTGLPSRRFLGESFRRLLVDQRQDIGHTAVLFVDLDRFKSVNDTYGHEVGDHLMRAVAERLVAAMRPQDVVVRYAGDEFVLVAPGVPNTGVAERIASRVIHVLETPFELGQDRIQISASIGIAIDDGHATTDDLVRDADAAMYQAKAHGSGTYALFEGTMRDRLTPATAEKRMRAAIDAGELRLSYRPVVSLWTRRVVSVEAVIRWEDPERGLVRPEEFLPALEETGLIVPVGHWVLREVCEQSRRWAAEFPDRPPVNFLVSVAPRQLSQSDLVDRLARTLHETGASPDALVIVVDERAISGDMGMLRQTIRQLRTIGVRIALRDAAAGLASLGHVRDIDLDILAVDATAVVRSGDDRRDAAVVAHVIGLAKALGIVTLARGVDDDRAVERLRTLGCDLAAGELFAPPVPPEVVARLFQAGAAWQPAGAPPPAHPSPLEGSGEPVVRPLLPR